VVLRTSGSPARIRKEPSQERHVLVGLRQLETIRPVCEPWNLRFPCPDMKRTVSGTSSPGGTSATRDDSARMRAVEPEVRPDPRLRRMPG
jgi:hypothetical protein